MSQDIPTNREGLTGLFRKLGAPEPELWARSQLKEGINQLHRYLFLREAWKRIVPASNYSWIDDEIAGSRASNAPYSGIGIALEALLDSGADRRLIAEVVRGKQAELLFGLCYLLEDPGLGEPEVANVGWTLVERDEEGQPTDRAITGLHESVLETDPTGNEMRPKRQ